MALAFHSHSSQPCGFTRIIFPRLPPKPSRPRGARGPLRQGRGAPAQPWEEYGFIPKSSSNTLSRCDVSGLQLATALLGCPSQPGTALKPAARWPGGEDGSGSAGKGVDGTSLAITRLLGDAVFMVAGSSPPAEPGLYPQPRHARPRRRRPPRATGKMSGAVSC